MLGFLTRFKQMVFERINSGGERLMPQETRNAIYDGPLNRLCIRLSKTAALCRLWAIPEPIADELNGDLPSNERSEHESFRRMEDVELVLRFLAYRQKYELHKGMNLGTYLDLYLFNGNSFSQNTLNSLEAIFIETIKFVEDVFGGKAFWLYRRRGKEMKWAWFERPTMMIYDPLMYVMSSYLPQAEDVRKKASRFQEMVADFYQENYAVFEGRNVNPSSLLEREQKFHEFIKNVLSGS